MKKGFTIIKVLIVVVILGILAAIVVPQFSADQNQQENVDQIADSVSMWRHTREVWGRYTAYTAEQIIDPNYQKEIREAFNTPNTPND